MLEFFTIDLILVVICVCILGAALWMMFKDHR